MDGNKRHDGVDPPVVNLILLLLAVEWQTPREEEQCVRGSLEAFGCSNANDCRLSDVTK